MSNFKDCDRKSAAGSQNLEHFDAFEYPYNIMLRGKCLDREFRVMMSYACVLSHSKLVNSTSEEK